MAAYNSMQLTFSTVEEGCGKILTYVSELENELETVKSTFMTMTDSWEGKARMAFEEDFNVMSQSMSTTLTTMREVTALIQNYNQSHSEVEDGFGSGSHVTLG